MVEVLPVETPTLGDRSYLAHDGPANTAGPAGPDLSPPRRADAAEVRRAIQAGEWVVDLRTQDVLDRTRVILVLPTAAMLSQPGWAKVLEGVAAGYGIEVREESQLVEVDGASNRAVISDTKAGTKETIEYDILHATPPQSAPDWVKATPLADPASPFGYVRVDKLKRYGLPSLYWNLMLKGLA